MLRLLDRMPATTRRTPASTRSTRFIIGVAGFAAIAAFFLFTEHRAHVLGALPFVLILAYPLLHLLTHGGHGNRHEGDQPDRREHRPPGRHEH